MREQLRQSKPQGLLRGNYISQASTGEERTIASVKSEGLMRGSSTMTCILLLIALAQNSLLLRGVACTFIRVKLKPPGCLGVAIS